MVMNVKPVPTLDDEVNEIRLATAEILNESVLPNEAKLWGWVSDSANAPNEVIEEARALRHEIQDRVKNAKLWAPHLPEDFGDSLEITAEQVSANSGPAVWRLFAEGNSLDIAG